MVHTSQPSSFCFSHHLICCPSWVILGSTATVHIMTEPMEPSVHGEHLAIGSVSSPIHTTFLCRRQCAALTGVPSKYHDLCKYGQGHIIANISASQLYYCQGFMKVQLNTHPKAIRCDCFKQNKQYRYVSLGKICFYYSFWLLKRFNPVSH